MMEYKIILCDNKNYLEHHGILGQKWGVRRYQNKDGTLTSAGRQRLGRLEEKYNKLDRKTADYRINRASYDVAEGMAKKDLSDSTTNLITRSVLGAGSTSGAAIVGSLLAGPIGAMAAGAFVGGLQIPGIVKAGIQNIYNKIKLNKFEDLHSQMIKRDQTASEIRQLKGAENNPFVSDDKSVQVKVNSSDSIKHNPTPANYESKYDNKYDINFLESIQNSKISMDNNIKAIDDEYDIFNKDPEDYFKNRSRKLESY